MRAESSKINRRLRLLCACAAFGSGPVLAQEGGDIQAQILYAYQAQDLAPLRDIQQSLSNEVLNSTSTPTAAVRYHLAHADYRLSLLLAGHGQGAAGDRLEECVDQLDALLKLDPSSVEALALQSLCYVELSRLKKLQALWLHSRMTERITRAELASPRNPRVKFVQAIEKLRTATPGQPVPQELQDCVRLFERSPATGNETPGWGHAEAYLLMGHELRVRGDIEGARNWIEKALIAAPDYKAAQLELARLTR